MAQQSPSQPPNQAPSLLPVPSRQTRPRDKVAKWLDEILGVLHVIGGRLLGPLWMTLFESLQDAIALGLLVKIPAVLSHWVVGKEFSGLDACWMGNNAWSVDRYACFAVVISDYTLWAVLIPRILYRFYRDLRSLQGGGHGSP